MFIGRRPDDSIYGMWVSRQPNDEHHQGMEELPDEHADVVAFVNRPLHKAVDKIAAIETRLSALEAKQ